MAAWVLNGEFVRDRAESRENVDFRMILGFKRFSVVTRGSCLNCCPFSASSLYMDQSAESKYCWPYKQRHNGGYRLRFEG